MNEIPKRIERGLRELAAVAHGEELRRALVPLSEAFEAWKSGSFSSGVLSERIHEFHEGPAQELFVRYNPKLARASVARAIATGILDREKVRHEILTYLENTIEVYTQEEGNP